MAQDSIAVLDTAGYQRVHVAGASMGGMIAQVLAARFPERVVSLTSIMSTTFAPHLPPPTANAEGEKEAIPTTLKKKSLISGFFSKLFS